MYDAYEEEFNSFCAKANEEIQSLINKLDD